MKNTKRAFTNTTDMMLVIMHGEYNSLEHIANILGRDEQSVKQRIIKLFETGKAHKIHQTLKDNKGLYSSRVGEMPTCRFTEDDEGEE